jgi:Ni/Fe-hydrogenase subunit HybB-like protein
MWQLALQAMNELPHATGYIYPNEFELHWSILIVIYPYLTGLVAGAFILASLERVFNVRALMPVYRLSLLTALSFLLIAPIPLMAHLGISWWCCFWKSGLTSARISSSGPASEKV